MSTHPYAERFPVTRGLPESGRPEDELLAELREMATEEDAFWETGKCSGTMYCGDHEHYDFMNQAFALFSHANILQRDMFPSATKLEGEIIAMTLSLLHGEAADEPVGMVTTGGTGSILHAVLSYREQGRSRGIRRPNIVKPETAHPAFDKACHLFDVELRRAPIDPDTTEADVAATAELIDAETVALVGSACNYGYGTVDPIAELAALASEREVGMHVDGCLGGFILPFGQELGYDIPLFDFRVPGVTSISADTHKYAYGLKGTSVLAFRDRALRDGQYFFLTDWTGGKYCSPGIEGSRSGGLLAATWAGMLRLGRGGYLRYAQRIFETSAAMQDAVRSHPELRLIGKPTFLFSFTSDEFDVYHVNDFMRQRGWRFNGQQYPNALHMAVTRPQTQPGVVDAFATDLADAVGYAKEHADEAPHSAAVYGGVVGGMTDEADEFIRAVMADMMDSQQALPASVTAGVGIDVGSTNVKVVRLDGDGALQATVSRPFATDRSGDVAEQDAEGLWAAVVDAMGEVAAGGDPVTAVGVCSQYSSIVPVDATGRPVGPLVMYWDQRGTEHCWAIMERQPGAFEAFVDHHGIPPIGTGLSLGHLLHFQLDRPEIHAATAAYLEPMDYLVARLTGRVAATQHSMFMSQVCDNRTSGTVAYDDELVALTGLDADRLPPLVEGGALVGVVTDGAAAGATVRAGVNDSAAGALAADAFAPGRGGLAIGTSAVLLDAVADKRVDLDAELVSMPCPAGGPYLAWAENGISGRAVAHGLDLLGADFADIEAALAATEPGAGGALFLPWLDGSVAPKADRSVRGGFVNLSVDTTRADLLRALVEGTAHNVRWLLPEVERFTGAAIESVAFVGGAARSPGWTQVIADMLGRPVGPTTGAECAGAQAVARHALGLDPAVPVSGWVEPGPGVFEGYAEAQARFEGAFAGLRSVYRGD